jgi:hypothetical protein
MDFLEEHFLLAQRRPDLVLGPLALGDLTMTPMTSDLDLSGTPTAASASLGG